MLQRYVTFFSPSRQNAVPVLRFGWGTRTAWFGFGERRGLMAKMVLNSCGEISGFGGHKNIWSNKKCVEIFSADLKNIHQCESFGSLVNNEVYRSCVEAEVLLHTWCKLNKWRYKNTRHVQTSAGDGLDESPDTWRPPLLRRKHWFWIFGTVSDSDVVLLKLSAQPCQSHIYLLIQI